MEKIGRVTDTWSSRFAFIMASISSAVGLGSFWRFPYTAGENGGGAFILIYVLCVVLIALPILMAEYAMGRKSGMSAIEGVQSLARAESQSQNWGIVSWTGALTAFFILSFYVVVSAWLVAYLVQALTGTLQGGGADVSAAAFADTIGQGENARQSRWHILFLLALFVLANVLVVGRGLKSQLERASAFLMPMFFLMLIGVAIYALQNGDAARTLAFMLEPRWEDVSFRTVLAAVGQAFFSIGVGMAVMTTYGAYARPDINIPRTSGIIAGADTLIALIAGFAIFPIVFAAAIDPATGPGLFFVAMPVAFEAIPGGSAIAGAFFLLALFAAFNCSVALMEVSVSWLAEREGVTRPGAALGIGLVLFMIGAAFVFSFDYLQFVDFITEGLLLPLGGLLAAVFAGWVLSREMLISELGEGAVMNVWRFLIRWLVPPFVAVVLVFGFLDMLQDEYHVPLPAMLESVVGPDWAAPSAG